MSDAKPHCYRYPHPAVTTDVVLFTIHHRTLKLLLIRRGREPHAGCWALPGGFLDLDEDLMACAERELREETGIGVTDAGLTLHEIGAFGSPGRDPRERVISIAYLALAAADRLQPTAGDDAADVGWFAFKAPPPLAFDHADIIATGHRRLLGMLEDVATASRFLPTVFTLEELRLCYEIFAGAGVDGPAFNAWALTPGRLEATGQLKRRSGGGLAQLYRVPSRQQHPSGAGCTVLQMLRASPTPTPTVRFAATVAPYSPTVAGPERRS